MGVVSAVAMDAPAKPSVGMVHVKVDALARGLESLLSLQPLLLGKDVLDLCLDRVDVHPIAFGELTQTAITVDGCKLNQTDTTTVASVVSSPFATFAALGVKAGFLTDVAKDNSESVFVGDAPL